MTFHSCQKRRTVPSLRSVKSRSPHRVIRPGIPTTKFVRLVSEAVVCCLAANGACNLCCGRVPFRSCTESQPDVTVNASLMFFERGQRKIRFLVPGSLPYRLLYLSNSCAVRALFRKVSAVRSMAQFNGDLMQNVVVRSSNYVIFVACG